MRPNVVHVSFDKSHSSPWEVYVYLGGKKIRLARAKTKAEAETLQRKYQDERNRRGTETPTLTAAQTDEYLRAKRALGDGVSLDVVVEGYLSRTLKPSMALETAVGGFVAEIKARNLAPSTVRDYRGKAEALLKKFPAATVEFFAQPPLEANAHPLLDFIRGVSEDAQTRIHYRTKLGTFFRWCEARNCLSVHPNRWVKLDTVSRESPQIYTPQQTEAIFRLFEKFCPRLVPYLSLQAFGALRPSEAARQTKERISFRERTIIASHKKRGADAYQTRLVEDLPPNIWAWLKPLRAEQTPSLVDSQDFYQQLHRILPEIDVKWIADGLRHSALTYYAKLHGHDRAAEFAGHRAGSYTLSKHYKATITTKRAARAYFSILPSS
jgi:integrase